VAASITAAGLVLALGAHALDRRRLRDSVACGTLA
jgi:hypothetical protein